MESEHYLTKMEKNLTLADTIPGLPEDIKAGIISNAKWVRTLASRLDQLDYDVRQETIPNIHRTLNNDYKKLLNYLPQEEKTADMGMR